LRSDPGDGLGSRGELRVPSAGRRAFERYRPEQLIQEQERGLRAARSDSGNPVTKRAKPKRTI